jgi:hypothetical protein
VSDVAAEPIELAWQPEPADYREVALVCRRRTRRIVSAGLGIWGLLFVVGAVLAHSWTAFGFGVGLWVYVGVLNAFVQRRAGVGFWKHDLLRSPKQAVLSAAGGVEVRSAESTGSYAWHAFATCQESERLFVLRLRKAGGKPGAVMVLPKRAFATAADLDGARSLLGQSVEGGLRVS